MKRWAWLLAVLGLSGCITVVKTYPAHGEEAYVVQTSSSVLNCWRTNPRSNNICSSVYINDDGESLATQRVTIYKDGKVVRPFTVGFSTSNKKDYEDRIEVYEDMAEALNAAHERREYFKLPLCTSLTDARPCRMDER